MTAFKKAPLPRRDIQLQKSIQVDEYCSLMHSLVCADSRYSKTTSKAIVDNQFLIGRRVRNPGYLRPHTQNAHKCQHNCAGDAPTAHAYIKTEQKRVTTEGRAHPIAQEHHVVRAQPTYKRPRTSLSYSAFAAILETIQRLRYFIVKINI